MKLNLEKFKVRMDVLSRTIAENDDFQFDDSDYDNRRDDNLSSDDDENDYSNWGWGIAMNFAVNSLERFRSRSNLTDLGYGVVGDVNTSRIQIDSSSRLSTVVEEVNEPVDISHEIEILNEMKCEGKNKVKEKLETVAKSITCVVCLVNKVQILTTPCNHMVTCGECYSRLEQSKCPFCRTKIEQKIIVRLP
jgi:hypothetical protein